MSPLLNLSCSVVYVWFNPVYYEVYEGDGVITMTVERSGTNSIPVNVSVVTQDINATGKADIFSIIK